MTAVMRRDHREGGQVIVEQALVMPLMVFLILGLVQLAMIQHARFATEYAAFSAARSGIVYNADKDMMRRAAFLALLPTMGRADQWDKVVILAAKASITQIVSDFLDSLELPGISDSKMVDVEILNPTPEMFQGEIGRHLNRKQIDFDDWRSDAAEANRLSIHVRYYYELRVPFANWMLQTFWFAHRASLIANFGGVNFATPQYRQSVGPASVTTNVNANMVAWGKAFDDDLQEVRNVAILRGAGLYYFPINTYYTMRMQSNAYLSNVEGD